MSGCYAVATQPGRNIEDAYDWVLRCADLLALSPVDSFLLLADHWWMLSWYLGFTPEVATALFLQQHPNGYTYQERVRRIEQLGLTTVLLFFVASLRPLDWRAMRELLSIYHAPVVVNIINDKYAGNWFNFLYGSH